MKPERAFVAERVAAQHCPELLRGVVAPVGDLMPRLGTMGEAMARTLAPALAPLHGCEALRVKAHAARQDDDLMFGAEVGPLAANTLFSIGHAGVPLLVSVQASAVLGLVDRTFGGRGELRGNLPPRFPLSADLMIRRVEALVANSLAAALNLPADAINVLRRDGSLGALAPFPDGAPLAAMKLEVFEEGREPWPLHVALLEAHLPALFDEKSAAPPPRVRGRADPAEAPFADLPLELSAVLVDMRMSMATLAALTPGQVLPVAVARQVPLKVAGKVIATGMVGEADDRVALRITQSFA
ncbi:FliM/FliN family flagellar motor switch protein [Novosphingobium sp. TH158]|uniref:FliM/FliN family flagellar motor switch protein n=1 Tax=Novosphingobium sp. TH158 TaxID=2067455 RepID=UPI000C798770|nr:FliM/FliN family flagellar motor switch protein [Novosphingobium sp. TH158]PLK27631.1 flagellar motor switch protein FliM [Novosphingobium sp. TH158]